MLVCPQCDFENSDNNKFCEKCGTSLTHKNCHECGTSVALSATNCDNCHAFTGKLWWAIISHAQEIEEEDTIGSREPILPTVEPEKELQNEQVEENQVVEIRGKENENEFVLSTLTKLQLQQQEVVVVEDYIDQEKRYKLYAEGDGELLEKVDFYLDKFFHFFQGKVLDTQPLYKSKLEYLLGELQEKSEEYEGLDEPIWNIIGIPAIALPYLTLEQELSPTIPTIHDAWLDENKEIVLLPDRSDWQLLTDLWQNPDTKDWEIIDYLDEMASLWKELVKVGCCQSLLVQSNLRVNEDENICLQQLYPDPPTIPLTIKNLGQMWQKLFEKSGKNNNQDIQQLLEEIENTEIKTVKELRSRLQVLAHQQEFKSNSNQEGQENFPQIQEIEDPFLDEIASGKLNDNNDNDELPTVALPIGLLSLTDAARTDIGHQRDHNEDCFGIEIEVKKQENPQGTKYQARGLYILCDGMGGHAAGEVASAMAVETVQNYFRNNWHDQLPDKETISQAILQANEEIYKINIGNGRSGHGRMGTTLVMLLIQNNKAAIAHVGDSRIYQFTRKGGIEKLTLDHAVGQQAILQGLPAEVAYARPDAYQLTQALGPRDNNYVEPEVQFLDFQEDTLILLCSDGLSDNDLIETQGLTYLSPLISSKINLETELTKLIDFANDYNGHDNITALAVRIKVQPNLEQKPLF